MQGELVNRLARPQREIKGIARNHDQRRQRVDEQARCCGGGVPVVELVLQAIDHMTAADAVKRCAAGGADGCDRTAAVRCLQAGDRGRRNTLRVDAGRAFDPGQYAACQREVDHAGRQHRLCTAAERLRHQRSGAAHGGRCRCLAPGYALTVGLRVDAARGPPLSLTDDFVAELHWYTS